jgi:hypothetical protein
MRYFISTILMIIVLVLSAMGAYCGYMAFTDTWQWAFVGAGILLPDSIAVLALTAALPASKEY